MKAPVMACVLLLAGASGAEAQAYRTWVAGLGDDGSSGCSRTAPCKTFASAISKTVAGGYIDAIDAGGYGVLTITKSITIDGGAGHAGVLAASGNSGITINGRGITVILRNLSIEGIDGALHGIRIVAAGRVIIENCTISNFANTGILVEAYTELAIVDTTVKKTGDIGIYVQNGLAATLTRVTTTANGGAGVLAGAGARVTVKDSVSSHNDSGYGAAFSATSTMTVENSVSANNNYGVIALSGGTVRLSNSTIVDSTTTAMFNDGMGNLLTFGNNQFAGNADPGVFTGSLILR